MEVNCKNVNFTYSIKKIIKLIMIRSANTVNSQKRLCICAIPMNCENVNQLSVQRRTSIFVELICSFINRIDII